MATLNYAFKEISCKLVYYGCGLCGKTTNLIHVHKTVPDKFRGELVSLATEQDRTLFFDFLPLDLGEVRGFKTKFQLYTVPGQVYYNATRKLVLRGVDGIVFVADSQKDRLQENIESFENLRQNLQEYGYHLQMARDDEDGIPWVLQLNKRDMPQISEAREIVEALGAYAVPAVESVAVSGKGVKETLKAISSAVIQKLNAGAALAPGATPPRPATAPAAAAPAPERPAPPPPRAPEPAPAPKAPTPSPTPVPAAAAAAESPKPSDRNAPPDLSVIQPLAARWRGIPSGSGSLNLARLSGSRDYQLTGSLSFLRVFRSTFSKRMVFMGSNPRTIDGIQAEFWEFETAPGQDGPAVTVYVEKSFTRSLFVRYDGMLGEVLAIPIGRTDFPR